MSGYFQSGTLYKGIFLVILILIALEYIFGSTNFVLNATKTQKDEPELHIRVNYRMKTRNESSYMKNNTQFPDISNSSNISKNLTILASLFDLNNSSDDQNTVNNSKIIVNTTELVLCPEDPPNLVGVVPIVKSPVPTIEQLESRFYWLKPGGHYSPEYCKVLKKVALIIPFRSRGKHLLLFLQHMHPFLKRQQSDYTIFIIEQNGNGPFNRALLMNVGYVEALKRRNYDCFIFHDIDLLPENDRNLYTCPIQPRHMSVAVDTMNYRLPYKEIFGGVSAISTEHFRMLNGFSNMFWGWGGEDDDMSNRIRHHKLYISRYPPTIARYTMLTHKKDEPSPNRYDVLKLGQKNYEKEGLNSLKYKVIKIKEHLLFTWILVGVDVPS